MKFLRKIWIWAVIAVVYLLLVHIIYLFPAPFSWLTSSWSAGDLLAYGGALIGAGATIYAVIATIEYERSETAKQNKLACKPWLETNLELISNYDGFNEYAAKGVVYVEPCEDAQWRTSLQKPFDIRKNRHHFNKESCMIFYRISNIGGNTATSIQFKINDQMFFPEFALSLNSEKSYIIILPLKENFSESKYQFKFTYGDIVSNTKYVQTQSVIVIKDQSGCTLSRNVIELLSKPIELEDQTNG